MDKKNLRRYYLKQRQTLSLEQWQLKSQQLCENLRQTPLFQRSKTILSYFSIRQEPDLSSLFSLNKNWGFSRCVEQTLVWHRWQPGDPIQTGSYGIQEPHPDCPFVDPQQVDLILVPAVACDRRGYRLGYGGGYYDRLFAEPLWYEIPRLGIIFESAYLAEMPIDPWDIPLSGVCTEKDFHVSLVL